MPSLLRGSARRPHMARQNCLNAHLDGDAVTTPVNAGQSLLDRIGDPKKLRALGFNRILRVARTLADLNHSPEKVAPALARYRFFACWQAG